MQITWHGLSCFEIKTKRPSGEATVVIDPYDNATGLRFPRTLEADVALVSHQADDATNTDALEGTPYIIDTPGEFEVKDVFFFGVAAPRKVDGKKDVEENLIFRVEVEGMHLAHLGAINRELTDAELQALENIDILMLPVGGERVLSPKLAATVIGQIEPRVVIPMTYDIPSLKEKLGSLDAFTKELGATKKEELNKYKVSRKDLPEEDMLIVVLNK